jgi:hypothetical protein
MRQALLAMLLLVSVPAHAGEAKIVLLSLGTCCTEEAWPEAEQAAIEELEGFGFTVEVVEGTAVSEKDRRIELLETAQQHDAICALRIVRLTEGSGVDLWIIDRVTGKMVYRQIPLDVAQGSQSAAIVALRVVELLRASLLELELPDVKPRIPTPPAAQKLNPQKPEGPVGLLTGASVLGSIKSVGPIGAINWIVSYRPIPPISVELEGLLSFASKGISEEIGDDQKNTSFDVAMARAWFLWFIRPTGIVRPVIGAGAGVLVPWAKEETASGRPIKKHGFVFYAGGTIKVVFAITRSFWIRTAFKIGTTYPEVVIKFNNEEVERFGLPLFEGQLLLEFRIP